MVIKTLDPDLHRIRICIQPKMLDPDPYRMNTDPKPCLKPSFGIRIQSDLGKRWNGDIFSTTAILFRVPFSIS